MSQRKRDGRRIEAKSDKRWRRSGSCGGESKRLSSRGRRQGASRADGRYENQSTRKNHSDQLPDCHLFADLVTHPLTPSLANVFFTTSIAPVYVPGAAVCRRVLVRSKGCPVMRKTRWVVSNHGFCGQRLGWRFGNMTQMPRSLFCARMTTLGHVADLSSRPCPFSPAENPQTTIRRRSDVDSDASSGSCLLPEAWCHLTSTLQRRGGLDDS